MKLKDEINSYKEYLNVYYGDQIDEAVDRGSGNSAAAQQGSGRRCSNRRREVHQVLDKVFGSMGS